MNVVIQGIGLKRPVPLRILFLNQSSLTWSLVMTQVEKQMEQFQTLIGSETSFKFEQQVASAILDLASALQNNFMDNEAKVSYATHVFAQMLDDLAEIVEYSNLVN